MYQILLYIFLNISGFLIFLTIWNWLPRPKPLDYTTIPGLKLNIASAEEIPNLELKPGSKVDQNFRGHFSEIQKFSSLQSFLDFLLFSYGPLNSFWWSSRYTVTVSHQSLIAELKKYRTSMLAISPFAIGSYIQGNLKYCTNVENNTLIINRIGNVEKDLNLSENAQNTIFMDCNREIDDSFEDFADLEQVIINLRQVEHVYKFDSRDIRKRLERPLLAVFDEEIWLDAHPIPKFIPIIINTKSIISEWSDDELFPKFYSIFYWFSGFQDLHEFV